MRGSPRALYALVLIALARAPLASQEYGGTTEDVRFESRGATLVGTLTMPDKPGPHPLIVTGHGSGRVTRSDLYAREVAGHFVPRGVAVFSFDKRGAGASGGEYVGSYSSSMVIYAVDLLEAVATLRARPDIDADQVGLFGMSQAGWVIPIAAAMSRGDVAFTMIVSGPTVSIVEENLYSDLTGSTNASPTGMSRAEINRRMAEAEPKGVAARDFIAELTNPGLWIYGSLDQSVPWERSIEDLRATVDEWDRDFTWLVFENANHGLRKARTGGQWERPVPREAADGYLEAMSDWLFGHAGVRVP